MTLDARKRKMTERPRKYDLIRHTRVTEHNRTPFFSLSKTLTIALLDNLVVNLAME